MDATQDIGADVVKFARLVKFFMLYFIVLVDVSLYTLYDFLYPTYSPQCRLMSKALQTITRITTTAISHPIHTWIKQSLRYGGLPDTSNLKNLN